MKIIPAIDIIQGDVVRLYRGDPTQKIVYSHDPVAVAKKWAAAGADILHIVDLDATIGGGGSSSSSSDETHNNLDIIKKIADSINIPIQVAGGLRTLKIIDDVSPIASRMVLGTLAFESPALLQKIYDVYGPTKIVISVDHLDGLIVTRGWQQTTQVPLHTAITNFTKMGFTEFLLTNVNRDGTLQGPDLDNLERACGIPNTNIIASGGISGISDVIDVGSKHAAAVILGKALYENKITIQEAKKVAC